MFMHIDSTPQSPICNVQNFSIVSFLFILYHVNSTLYAMIIALVLSYNMFIVAYLNLFVF